MFVLVLTLHTCGVDNHVCSLVSDLYFPTSSWDASYSTGIAGSLPSTLGQLTALTWVVVAALMSKYVHFCGNPLSFVTESPRVVLVQSTAH